MQVTPDHYRRKALHAATRAARAVALAEEYERRAGRAGDRLKSTYLTLAMLHRQTQERHQAVARLYERHAQLSETRTGQNVAGDPYRAPTLFDSVADLAGDGSIYVRIVTETGTEVSMVSDASARIAHNAEVVLGFGPSHACLHEGPMLVRSAELRSRWPLFADATSSFTLDTVASVPMWSDEVVLGTLTRLMPTPPADPDDVLDQLSTVGEAVAEVMTTEFESPAREPAGLLEGLDYNDRLHQAAGIVAVQCNCAVDEALTRLRARAFVSGGDIAGVASAVIAGDLHLET